MRSSTEAHRQPEAEPQPVVRPTKRAADVLIDILIASGVDTVFGLPGGTIAPLHDALLDRPEVRVITTRHESGAMFAAAGYARMTGKLGVVLVTSGPGILNSLTGAASAYCDGLPVLLLAGEVPRQVFGRNALQEGSANHLDIVGMCRHISKLALQVPRPDVAPAMLKRAIMTALSGRKGPVIMTLPLDVTSAQICVPELTSEVGISYALDSVEMSRAIRDAAQALRTAQRPVIFAGSGARWGRAPELLRELAERLQIPVITTPKGKGVFPESHPLSLGIFGHGGHPSSTAYLSGGIDTLLVVASGLTDPATDGWSDLLKPTRDFIQIDADVMQLGRNYPVTQGLVGAADSLLEKLNHRLRLEKRPPAKFGVERYLDPETCEFGPEGRITPQRALWELQKTMPADTIYTSDIGEHLLFATHYLQIDDPQGFLIMTGLASMGSGIAGAIGARLAFPDRPAVAICGDGCYSMGLGDVAVAARDSIPLLVAVLNDERYGMVEIGHEAVYGRRAPYPAGPMDVLQLARGVGAAAKRIEHAGQILELDLIKLLGRGPVVLDISIDREVKMPKNQRNESLRVTEAQRAAV